MPSALIVGGTGPTGHFMVNGLIARGYAVTILHTGRHEVDEIPPEVVHIHTDPSQSASLEANLEGLHFDLAIITYGSLRRIAEVMASKADRIFAIGGAPIYRGYARPDLLTPTGLPAPTGEDAPLVTSEDEDPKGALVSLSERALFDACPTATYFRYPFVYGKYQYAPKEWLIVRRIMDRRPFIVLPDGGLMLNHAGYAANLAHGVLLAVDRPDVAAGQSYNCGDEVVLTLRQQVEVCCAALGHSMEIVSMPFELAIPARPLVTMPWSGHRMFDLSKIKADLGYADVVAPAEALASTARALRDSPGVEVEQLLRDPFDYAAEDRLVSGWRELVAAMPKVHFKEEPWYIGYGPDGLPAKRRGAA